MATEFEKLASGLYLEGLAVEPDGKAVWYSDVIAGGIHRVDADGAKASFNEKRMWTGGLLVDAAGGVLSTGQAGIMRTDPAIGESTWLLDEIDDGPINGINEMAPDGHGGLWFDTVDLEMIVAGQPARPAAIYHFSADGTVRSMCEGIGFTNGMALSPDGRTLYCNESFDGVYAHDVAGDLTLSGRRKLLDKPDCDGMALDADGNLWVTGFRSGHFERIAPDGERLEPFETPAAAITQVRFGGPDMRDIWFVSVPDDVGEKLAKGDLPTVPNSHLWHARSPVAGYRVPPVLIEGKT